MGVFQNPDTRSALKRLDRDATNPTLVAQKDTTVPLMAEAINHISHLLQTTLSFLLQSSPFLLQS